MRKLTSWSFQPGEDFKWDTIATKAERPTLKGRALYARHPRETPQPPNGFIGTCAPDLSEVRPCMAQALHAQSQNHFRYAEQSPRYSFFLASRKNARKQGHLERGSERP